jgi:murein DD-endopeptidase MepM/ murein hydrolase activator NlpD
MKSLLLLVALTSAAAADPTVTIAPKIVHPGDPVLVTVTGTTEVPHGKAGGQSLAFFAAHGGYQAVFAVPLSINEDHVLVELGGATKPVSVALTDKTFPETSLVVEEDLANPSPEDKKLIDADNAAIGASYAKAAGDPQFTRAFHAPRGKITSTFGEWRTFNDGHRAQHLGVDYAAQEGSPVVAINDGTVVLVRETFLAGNVVVVAHGGGIASLYFHLQKPTVAEGDTVHQGERIGLAGHTGRTTGPHLHVSIRVHGGLVDPSAFFKLPIGARTVTSARVRQRGTRSAVL